MSYLDETDLDIRDDIISRKEFYLLSRHDEKFANDLHESDISKNIIPKFLITDKNLQLKSYQLFVNNYFNPNTPYTRLLLKWMTGSGKTIAAISIALNYIKFYQKQQKDEIGSIYILGFTQHIFKNELLKYPELGFISREELDTLNKLKEQARSENPADIDRLKKFLFTIKKRFSNRKENGFFKFYGYKELANHLLLSSSENIISLSEEEITAHIKDGTIKLNTDLLEEFQNSLIICDEIHNVYNSTEKNIWGIVIQIILNYHNSCRAVFLSATPLNNSPSEIIDLLNLLLPRRHYPILYKKDFFDRDDTLLPNKTDTIRQYLEGRVSFIIDQDPSYIASKEFIGTSIPGIKYLKFIRCPMSPFHYKTYKNIEEELGLEGQYILDFALPNPKYDNPFENIGLYKTKEIADMYMGATSEWKNNIGLYYDNEKDIVSGDMLNKKSLRKISSKYHQMITDIHDLIHNKKGKIFIYHNSIHVSGTIFISEILLRNNIIGEFDTSNSDTLCSICGKIRKHHTANQLDPTAINIADHYYEPVRFVIVHSNIDRKQINRSLEKFNDVNNVNGSKFMILIGSKIIKESHSINSVRNLLVMSKPDNIPSLIQIMGRVIRLGSHKLLDKKHRHVDIRIYTSCILNNKKYEMGLEEIRYREKIRTYEIILNIEQLLHESAIDAYNNYQIITKNFDNLAFLPYTIKPKTFNLNELNYSTFNAYYAKFEVNYVIYMIKRLFIEFSPIWTYDDLFTAIKNPPFKIELNPTVLSEELFTIALTNLVYTKSNEYTDPAIESSYADITTMVDKLHDPADKILYQDGSSSYVIAHVGELYAMCPLYNEELITDTESIFRKLAYTNVEKLDLNNYLQSVKESNYNDKKAKFINKWKNIPIQNLEQVLVEFNIKFHQIFLEDTIEYVFNVWTNPTQKKDENHDFYIKMLYYYDLTRIVIWAHELNNKLYEKYDKYVFMPKIEEHVEDIGTINYIKTSLSQSSPDWISTGMVKQYTERLHESEALFDGIYKKSAVFKKIPANLLPVGHYISKVPRLYNKSTGWNDEPGYIESTAFTKENDIVVGSDTRMKTQLGVKFKLRNPQKRNLSDARLIERGSVCTTKSKSSLKNIAVKLGIKLDGELSLLNICNKIRNRLIYLELQERIKKTGIRYYYFVYES